MIVNGKKKVQIYVFKSQHMQKEIVIASIICYSGAPMGPMKM